MEEVDMNTQVKYVLSKMIFQLKATERTTRLKCLAIIS